MQAGEEQEVAEADVPHVSVVLPVLNGDCYLAQAIESVLSQTLRDLELVIVDDGSTDRSRTIVETFAGCDGRVRLIVNETTLGLASALNSGWRARDCLERAASYEILGHRDESAALLGQAQRTLGKGTRRRFAAAVELKRADARLTSHRPVAGVAHASLAVLNAPGYATSRLASRVRDRLYGRAFW